MGPDRELVDQHLELARHLCRDSIAFMERQLGVSTLRPPGGKALIRRLSALRARLDQLDQVLDAISHTLHSVDRTPGD